jgi:hypothetical protein
MTAAQSAAAATDPAELIRTLGNQAIEAIRSAASPDQRGPISTGRFTRISI